MHPNYEKHRSHPYRPDADLSQFWAITVISNPVRYKRRYELFWRFKEMCKCAGVNLIVVEQAFGHRPWMVTSPDDPYDLQVRSIEELWHKENMINLGVRHAQTLGPVREIAWIDADCRPAMPSRMWFEETWHQLQVYEFVQMWEHMIDLDYRHNAIGSQQPSFMANYVKHGTPHPELFHKMQDASNYGYGQKLFGRPGLAWAANLSAFNAVGGCIDFSILGAADYYMALGLVGAMKKLLGKHVGIPAYTDKLLHWQTLCERWIKRDVGYVPGLVYHDWHGRKANRGYGTRGSILVKNKYDPNTDIKYDGQGLLQLETSTPRQMRLRDEIRRYFRSRNEDDIS